MTVAVASVVSVDSLRILISVSAESKYFAPSDPGDPQIPNTSLVPSRPTLIAAWHRARERPRRHCSTGVGVFTITCSKVHSRSLGASISTAPTLSVNTVFDVVSFRAFWDGSSVLFACFSVPNARSFPHSKQSSGQLRQKRAAPYPLPEGCFAESSNLGWLLGRFPHEAHKLASTG